MEFGKLCLTIAWPMRWNCGILCSDNNSSSATAFDELISVQIHMLYIKIVLLKMYVQSLEYLKLSMYPTFRFITQCFVIFLLYIYIYFINAILFSEAVLCGFSYEKVFWEYAEDLRDSFRAKVWFLFRVQ